MHTIRDVIESKGDKGGTVYSIAAECTVQEAVARMCGAKVGALLVLSSDGRRVGIVSERDLLVRVLLAKRAPDVATVGDVMTRNVISVDVDCEIDRAMALMTYARCRHLPVLEDGELVGLVSIGDLVRAVSSDRDHELEVIREYVDKTRAAHVADAGLALSGAIVGAAFGGLAGPPGAVAGAVLGGAVGALAAAAPRR
jgi:CBS domain-containing protein